MDGGVVSDELEVADVVEVDVGAVGHQRRELLLDGTLEREHLAVAGVLHQSLDEVRHLQNDKESKISQVPGPDCKDVADVDVASHPAARVHFLAFPRIFLLIY